jgi:ATP-dependent Lon protease
LQSRLQQLALPPEVRRTAERELDRLAGLTSASADYSTVRGYLQCIADLPWAAGEEPELDLEAARAVLDRDHYGLPDVKERILEYLAVRKLRLERRAFSDIESPASSAPGDPVLCLVGPPGIGKTSLGRSVAEALGRQFVRISLGGISDEAEIRGHRRTYVGAMPGKIVQSLTRASSVHPVIMLDEIDKVGSGGKGDPASALLEVLDPEQQRTFLDHYLDVPYDLSQVFFIATANMLDNVPPALRDRLEVIQLSGYTEEEKIQIALRHIIPRQLEWHALTPEDIAWQEDAVLAIVRSYTREAGVRQLEREIATLCRRVATLVAQGESDRPYTVDPDFVADVLGTPRFIPERAEVTDQPGVVTGVVWTPVGGDIIHVEASIMPGRKTLTITGQLGEIMRESAQAALSFVRAEAGSLGVDPEFFEHHDVHLHVPSGAVPKDGPSAGITMAAALVSLLTGKAVPADVAMTGEITLRGRVLPVGGIREKILAARRAGIRLLILPHMNRRDLDSIPGELLDGIDFAFVDNMQAVLDTAFSSAQRSGSASSKERRKRGRSDAGEASNEMPRAAKRR